MTRDIVRTVGAPSSITQIYGGTNQVRRIVVAKHPLR